VHPLPLLHIHPIHLLQQVIATMRCLQLSVFMEDSSTPPQSLIVVDVTTHTINPVFLNHEEDFMTPSINDNSHTHQDSGS